MGEFRMGGPGPVVLRDRDFVNAKDHGVAAGAAAAVNDTGLAEALSVAGGRPVILPGTGTGGIYNISVDVKPDRTQSLIGESVWQGTLGPNFDQGTVLKQTDSSKPVVSIPNAQAGQENFCGALRHLHLKGGTDSIQALNGMGQAVLYEVQCDGYSRAAVYWQGQVQDVMGDKFYASGGQYGLYHAGVGGSTDPSGSMLIDKSHWGTLHLTSHSVNGINLAPAWASTTFIVDDLRLLHIVQDGAVFGGGWRQIQIGSLNVELNGYLGSTSQTALTTGSITTATNTLTVASVPAGWVAGTTVLTVENAGANGTDLTATIASAWDGVSTSVALTTNGVTAKNAGNTVGNAEVTAALYCDLRFLSNGGGAPARITISNAELGGESANSGNNRNQLRYAADFSGCNDVALINCDSASRDYYDPNKAVLKIQGNARIRHHGGKARSNLEEQSLPTGFVAQSWPRIGANLSSLAITSGTMRVTPLPVRAGQLISKVWFECAANNTASSVTHAWVCLMDSSRVLLAQSVDGRDGGTPTSDFVAATPYSWTLTTPYKVTTDGLLTVGLVVVSSATVPSFYGAPSVGIQGLAPVIGGTSSAGLTDPASGPGVGGTATAFTPTSYFWLGVA